MRNSTIKQKIGECCDCMDGKSKHLIAGRCQFHYQQYRTLINMNKVKKQTKRPELMEDGLTELIDELDSVFSRYVRLFYSDEKGIVKCVTCGHEDYYGSLHNGHYISRSSMYLRWDFGRNCFPQCPTCNILKNGNLGAYTKFLESKSPGITEILMEESKIVYHPSRSELKQLINEYSGKVIELLKIKNIQ